MKIYPAILELLNAYRQTLPEMTFTKNNDIIMHAQRIIGNGAIIPPHNFEHLSHCHYQL
jgi:hypothetical protein